MLQKVDRALLPSRTLAPGEYPFHFDDPEMVKAFFSTLQDLFLERFHPHLITARTYTLR